jgi:hypothetical protein
MQQRKVRKADVRLRVGHEALAVLPIRRGTFGLFMSARQTRLGLSDSNRGEMRSHFSRNIMGNLITNYKGHGRGQPS